VRFAPGGIVPRVGRSAIFDIRRKGPRISRGRRPCAPADDDLLLSNPSKCLDALSGRAKSSPVHPAASSSSPFALSLVRKSRRSRTCAARSSPTAGPRWRRATPWHRGPRTPPGRHALHEKVTRHIDSFPNEAQFVRPRDATGRARATRRCRRFVSWTCATSLTPCHSAKHTSTTEGRIVGGRKTLLLRRDAPERGRDCNTTGSVQSISCFAPPGEERKGRSVFFFPDQSLDRSVQKTELKNFTTPMPIIQQSACVWIARAGALSRRRGSATREQQEAIIF